MKNIFFPFLFLPCVFFMACNNRQTAKEPAALPDKAAAAGGIDFTVTDSAELVFYPNPANQKEFETFWIKDTATLRALVQNLSVPEIQMQECTHEVKLYLYDKGDVFKTVYASLAPDCQYLAFAVNASPHFYPLTPAMQQALEKTINKR